MVVMGTVLRACYYFFAQGEGFAQIGHVSGSLVLAALMAVPCVGGEGNVLNGVYNAVCILLVFPLVVLMGAGSRLTDARSVRVCTFLGELSYPLYITHFPLIYMQMSWVWAHPDAPPLRPRHGVPRRVLPGHLPGLGMPEALRPARARVAQAALADEDEQHNTK